jgi:hypothetical protein
VPIEHDRVTLTKILSIGLLIGFLLNLLGWLGNNILLQEMWQEVGETLSPVKWRDSLWHDIFSLAPDFLYGIAIAWLCVKLRTSYKTIFSASLAAGIYVSLVGGVTTYFAIANSGFIRWDLAVSSFVLVIATTLPLAILAGYLLMRGNHERNT